ncbi:MAG: CBS domain-containing protein [Acidobacteriia bacterium]|nr:CBS domain-containing protein [Terriglobia bacterium]
MKCEEIMISELLWCVPTDTVETAAKMMKTANIDVVPVCEGRQNERPVGIVTDHEIVLRVVADGLDATKMTLEAVMTREPVTCYGEDDLDTALDAMERNQVQRILVVGQGGRLAGVLTQADVLLWTGEPTRIVELIRKAAQGRRASQSGAKSKAEESGLPKVRHGGGSFS